MTTPKRKHKNIPSPTKVMDLPGSDAPIMELADFLINRYLMADNSRYR